jgi:GNAT superfamily N-acetyltransferase
MSENHGDSKSLTFKPAAAGQWENLVKLFGVRGGCGGCWCMWWRLKRSEFEKQKGEGNKKSLKKIIESGEIPGLIAYAGDQPVAWCSVAPRHHFTALDRSRVLRRVDDEPVWSIVCFFVAKPYRRRGVSSKLIGAAVEYAKKQGALIIEGYPVEPKKESAPDVFMYTGLYSAFKKSGFVEVCRRSETRPVMRYHVSD